MVAPAQRDLPLGDGAQRSPLCTIAQQVENQICSWFTMKSDGEFRRKLKTFPKLYCHLSIYAMKSLNYPGWARSLKVFLVGAALTLSVVSEPSGEVWAQSKSQTVKQQILALRQSEQRWIQIKLSNQRLTAWEGDKPVYTFIISTGKKSTPTPTGVFKIQSKQKSARMQGEDYDIPNVPYTMYYSGSYGIHGAYWHKKFGTPVSHGCTNIAPKNAKLLFNWASIGTPVVVQR